MSASDDILLEADGRLALPAAVREQLQARGERFEPVVQAPGVLVMRARSTPGVQGEQRLLMAGEIVTRTSVVDVINMVASAGWSGVLHVQSSDAHRCLHLAQGALKWAWSNVASEHLGEMLTARNALTAEQLAECLLELAPETRFGEILVRKGHVTREALFGHLRDQLEHIFYGALLTREGAYAFLTEDAEEPPASTTFHIPVQPLLMEGVQRIDEMGLFRERVPHGLLCPEATGSPRPRQLDKDAERVLERINGHRSVLDIARELSWDEFRATKAVHTLLESGLCTLRTPPGIDRAQIEPLVENFNAVLRDIFAAMDQHGASQETRTTLETWIQGSGYADFFGSELDPAVGIDVARLLSALEQADLERPLEALHQALHELTSFAMFAATPLLPREAELVLARKVDQRLRSIPPARPPRRSLEPDA